MGNTTKNILSFVAGYALSKYKEKRKLKNSSLAEHIEKYIKENDPDVRSIADDLNALASYYEAVAEAIENQKAINNE